MKFTVNIEEAITQEFEVDAENEEQALEFAIEKYKQGEFVLDDVHVSSKQVAIVKFNADYMEWVEF